MRAILCVLFALLALPAWAERPQVEVGVGITHTTHQDNGTWWQEEFPHDLTMNSPSLSVGLKQPMDRAWLGFDRWYVRAGYEYLGAFKSSALASASDEDYWGCRYHTETCWPLSHWYGRGAVHGLYLTVMPEIDMGSYAIFFEAGASLYRSSWRVDIPDWRPTREGPVQSLTATHATRWEPTYLIGLGVRRGPFAVSLTRRDARASGDLFPAIYHGPAYNLSLRYAF